MAAGIDTQRVVSIPYHLEPDLRFALIRLSENLLPMAFTARLLNPFSVSTSNQGRLPLPFGSHGHAPSLTVSLDGAEVGSLPSGKVELS
jgi:hypothetical protein